MSLIGLLVMVLIICVVCWAVRALLTAFSVPAPLATVIWVVVVVLCLFAFLNATGLLATGPRLRL